MCPLEKKDLVCPSRRPNSNQVWVTRCVLMTNLSKVSPVISFSPLLTTCLICTFSRFFASLVYFYRLVCDGGSLFARLHGIIFWHRAWCWTLPLSFPCGDGAVARPSITSAPRWWNQCTISASVFPKNLNFFRFIPLIPDPSWPACCICLISSSSIQNLSFL